jgi:hypothetical protein
MNERFHKYGQPIKETYITNAWASELTDYEAKKLIVLLCERLGLSVYRTNDTDSGDMEIEIRGQE